MQRPSTVGRGGLTPWAMGVAILGLVLACYWPALRGGVLWDDGAHITQPELRSWAGLGRIWTDIHATQQYYPVLHSAFWVEHRLWGDATLGYHLVNGLWHATACLLLALGLRRLWAPGRATGGARVASRKTEEGERGAASAPPTTEDGRGAPVASPTAEAGGRLKLARVPAGAEWLAAVLFAVHPVGVESVAWMAEQKNTLSLVFYLAAALAYLGFEATRRRRGYAWATLFFLLALATKSVTATLPAALLVVLWWRGGALRWRRDVGPLLPWFAAALAAGSVTAWIERTQIGAHGAGFDLSFGERVLLAGRAIWFYLGKLVWPADLMFVYPRWDVHAAAGAWYGWLAGAGAVTVALWAIRRRTRGPLAGWLFFVGSLFPALGFFNVYPFLFSYVADHFQYLASLGVVVVVAVGIAEWWAGAGRTGAGVLRSGRPGGRALRGAIGGGVVVLVGGLALLANRQSRTYRDGPTLYRATLAKNPACWMAHTNLAVELAGVPGHTAAALAHYDAALRLKPDNAEAHNDRGNLLVTIAGREAEGVAEFAEAVRLEPAFIEAQLNLANALAKDPRRWPDARAHFDAALRLRPDYAETHFCLANALAAMPGREAGALAEYTTALRLQPDHADAHANLAELLARLPGRSAEAEAQYAAALRLAPGNPKTHYNFALWLEGAPGRRAEAAAQYEEALRLDPGYAQAHNNLGILFAQRGRFDAARAQWEAAVKAKPDDADALRNLRLLDERERRQGSPGAGAR